MRQEAFEALYERYAQDLFAFLAYRTGDWLAAEDLAADTFERAFRARAKFDRRRASEKTWLYSIALNALRDYHRRSQTREAALGLEGSRADDLAPDALGQAVSRVDAMAALELLSPEEREAVALRFGGDLTVPEIAAVTGQSVSTTEGRVYRALRKLRAAMAASAD